MSAYIGAGGGGDTVMAALRALCHQAGPCCVLGAGYAPSDYYDALTKGQNDHKTGEVQRKSCHQASVQKYLSKVKIPIHMDKSIATPLTDVWRVGSLSKEEMVAFVTPLLPPGKHMDWRDTAGFKYRTLIEESSFHDQVTAKGRAVELDMFVSTEKYEGTPEFARMVGALRGFVDARKVQQLVLLDVGGDILDFSRYQRDVSVLLACVQVAVEWRIRLLLEVYGAGCDAHADAATAQARLEELAQRAGIAISDEQANFCRMLAAERQGLAVEVAGVGRAGGNFLLASKLIKQVDEGTTSLGQAYEEYTKGLHARTEYKYATDDWRASFDSSNAVDKRATLIAGARTFVFELVELGGKVRALPWAASISDPLKRTSIVC
eukprot:gb/GEZN01010951.1/.p1 GENE.gb/GEZN01010951.1/~~gb/GEZN01010951.1/.p1  ORF type:complete len:388 (-),score=48.76 gb/GEZN01010951.1/:35-1168(-)